MRRSAAIALLLAGSLTACGGGAKGASYVPPRSSAPSLESIPIPKTLAGLTVERDAKATKELNAAPKKLSVEGAESYAVNGAVYTLRYVLGKVRELKAVLQITRLSDEADVDDKEFRQKVVDQIGRGPIKPNKHGEILVYERTALAQTVYVWFFGRILYVLSIRTQQDPSSPVPPADPLLVLNDSLKVLPVV